MSLTIDNFWRGKFENCATPGPSKALGGWTTEVYPVEGFVEPDLTARTDFDNLDARVILVAAPGAVGKSTLARALAAQLGLVLVDLSTASTVGGNYLSGGLVHTGLISAFQAGNLGLVVDALDEARLRVVSASYDDFIEDVVATGTLGGPPLVLLGREGVVEDTWLRLSANGVEAAILDIQRFTRDRALGFVQARLKAKSKSDGDLRNRLAQFGAAYNLCSENLIGLLAAATGDGDHQGPLAFAGYAPVLEAVAEFVSGLTNPNASLDTDFAGKAIVDAILQRILDRESEKIRAALAQKHPGLSFDARYGAEEQRSRLLALLGGTTFQPSTTSLPANVVQAYEDAVAEFLPQHPFLDGAGRAASSAVFEADILCHSMLTSAPANAEKWARHSKPGNPFLIDMFYRRTTEAMAQLEAVAPEHLGSLFASAQALAGPNEYAEFEFEQVSLGEDSEAREGTSDAAEVSIELISRERDLDKQGPSWKFKSSTLGEIKFLGTLGHATVMGSVDVAIGDASGTRIDAPTSIECHRLRLLGQDLTISNSVVPRRSAPDGAEEVTVVLVASELDAPQVSRVRLMPGASFAIEWPGDEQHPWTSFSSEAGPAASEKVARARLAIRRLVIAFRSHSKGRLARYAKKIEHRRMTKGELGTIVRESMLDDGILTLEGNFYFLDADKLGKVVNATFLDLYKKQFNPEMDEWIRTRILTE